MKPVVDFRVEGKFSPTLSALLEQVWVELARARPGESFIFLTEETVAEGLYPPNIIIRTVKKSSFAWLDQRRLLNSLDEWQADTYITFGQGVLNSMKPAARRFSKKDLLQPAQRIVFSEYSRLQLPPLPGGGSTHFVKPALPGILSSLPWAEVESIRTRYTGGREYFLYTGDIDEQHRLIDLLKAFSSFKKRQQSNMQLVIAGFATDDSDTFEEKLSSYKYRADVVVLKEPAYEETLRLAAACYAIVYPFAGDVLPQAVLLAIQTGVALVACDTPVNRELAGEAAAWTDAALPEEDLARAMMLLYKDEERKQELVQKAKEQAAGFSPAGMLDTLAQIIYPH
jgi:glycosyltransferase involved in cell wall biosynthesis